MSEEEKKKDIISEDDKNLNWDEWDKKSFTLEEVQAREETLKKEINSNHEKWVQKLIGKEKVLDIVLNKVKWISEKPESLVDLFSENEEAAKIILDKYYGWKSIEEFKTDIEYEPDYSDPKMIEQLAEDKANKKFNSKLINDKKDAFIKNLEMSWEELEKFEAEFEDRKGLKSFNYENIQKQLESAYRDSNWDAEALKKVKANQAIAAVMWTGDWKSGGKENKKPITSLDKARAEAKWILGKYLK